MAFLSQNNNLQNELTIEESIFASDDETLKVIFIYKTMETKKNGCVRVTKNSLEL
jgi:hypothetical protein